MSTLLLLDAAKAVETATKAVKTDYTTLIVVGVICFIIGFIIAKLLGGSSSSNSKLASEKSQLEQKQVELKSELEAVRETSQASLEKVEAALANVQNLALEMANTYQSLNLIKANLNGETADNKQYLLQIKNGKLEQVEYSDVEPEAEESAEEATTESAEK